MINVSWQQGGGAVYGGPGVIYQLPPGQDTTPPIPFTVSVLAGWGGGPSDYTGSSEVQIRPPEGCTFVNDMGQLVSSIPCNLSHGTGGGQVRVKVMTPSMPGGNFRDVGLFCLLPDGSGGGQSNNMRVVMAAAPPQTKITWEVKVNGASLGYVLQTNQGDNVTFHRENVMVWPNYMPGR